MDYSSFSLKKSRPSRKHVSTREIASHVKTILSNRISCHVMSPYPISSHSIPIPSHLFSSHMPHVPCFLSSPLLSPPLLSPPLTSSHLILIYAKSLGPYTRTGWLLQFSMDPNITASRDQVATVRVCAFDRNTIFSRLNAGPRINAGCKRGNCI